MKDFWFIFPLIEIFIFRDLCHYATTMEVHCILFAVLKTLGGKKRKRTVFLGTTKAVVEKPLTLSVNYPEEPEQCF